MAHGPKNIWFENEDNTKPTALELYEKIVNEQFPNEDGTNIFYFPRHDTLHYGYAVEFIENSCKGSMMEEFVYTVFKRVDDKFINSNQTHNKDKLHDSRTEL
eukprot:314595_1